jgi:hypothetical protein
MPFANDKSMFRHLLAPPKLGHACRMSIGVQKGPSIGAQKGTTLRFGGGLMRGAHFALAPA